MKGGAGHPDTLSLCRRSVSVWTSIRGSETFVSSGIRQPAGPFTLTICPEWNVNWTSVRGQLSQQAETLGRLRFANDSSEHCHPMTPADHSTGQTVRDKLLTDVRHIDLSESVYKWIADIVRYKYPKTADLSNVPDQASPIRSSGNERRRIEWESTT